jgi:hypothetical protein
MNRTEVREWKKAWQRVAERQRELHRQLTPTERLRQLAALLRMAQKFGWTSPQSGEQVASARARWAKVRSKSP